MIAVSLEMSDEPFINQQNYAKTQPVQKMHNFKKREEEQSEEPYLIIIWT